MGCSSSRPPSAMAVVCEALSALLLSQMISAGSVCVSGCSCSDEPLGRSLLCTELPLGRIPPRLPENATRIRFEKSQLHEIPQAAFSAVSALAFLWLNFNNIMLMNVRSLEGLHNLTELRIQGNKLRSIPWTVFRDTPNLEILDLKHNRIDVLPEHALRLLPKLTFFDLSFNQLSVISRDVFLNWPRVRWEAPGIKEEQANVVLALHSNPWLCDCRLKGFVDFINTVSPPIILMNSYMTCSGPESHAGRFFHELELRTCSKPETSSPQMNITSLVGSKVTLRCLVKSRPEALINWSYSLNRRPAFTVSQTLVGNDTISSALIIPGVHVSDRGIYTCTANNFIGNSSVGIQLDVVPRTAPLSRTHPLASVDETVYIDIHIAKQSTHTITIEWLAHTQKPAETWYTVYFGRYNASKKDAVYVGPGTSSYSVSDLLPLTKYEVCVTVRNNLPRDDQCVVFVTDSDVNQLEWRARLIHIIVVVCAIALAVPAGMCACTSDTKMHCGELYNRHKKQDNRPETFDSLQAGDSCEVKKRPEDQTQKGNSSAQLY